MNWLSVFIFLISGKYVSCSKIFNISSNVGDFLDLSCSSMADRSVYGCYINSPRKFYELTHGLTWSKGRIRSLAHTNSSCGLTIQPVQKQDEGIWSCALRIPLTTGGHRREITQFRITVKESDIGVNTSTYHDN